MSSVLFLEIGCLKGTFPLQEKERSATQMHGICMAETMRGRIRTIIIIINYKTIKS